jgi:LacI family transcriptional regulator
MRDCTAGFARDSKREIGELALDSGIGERFHVVDASAYSARRKNVVVTHGSSRATADGRMKPPRVLVVLGSDGDWCRGILHGFLDAARERDWELLHYHPGADLGWLVQEWRPACAVLGPGISAEGIAQLGSTPLVALNADLSAEGIASVCLDEERIAALAVEHLLATGLRHLSTFRYDLSEFAIARERAFIAHARAAGAHVAPGWGDEAFLKEQRREGPAMATWLRSLPRPCGVFTSTDGWARPVARYAREAGLRIPDDLAVVGAGNDLLECELISPPLSSVIIPWPQLGREAATLVRLALAGQPVRGQRTVVTASTVASRRSSELLAVPDALVAEAVTWIRAHPERKLTVVDVARAVGGGRQRLERRFRRALNRTVQEEIRRAHVELAKQLLATSNADLSEVARRSGFSSPALLNAAFQRELGMPPGTYRRHLQEADAPSAV